MMKTKFSGILTLLLAFFVQVTFAQEKTITGTVSDESGSLPGVSVIVKGTTIGTETDLDGKYSIKAKQGDILVFSFVGMKTKELSVGGSNTMNITLESGNLLDEVVVVGYGTTTKKSFTGTAKVVKAENIEAKSVSNIAQALSGEASGVSVTRTSGKPGSGASIRIRGFSSIQGNRAPLYVVDGVPFSSGINSVNPSDIESTTILKDASATAIYGSRGANGVILITTKKGKLGKSSIEFDAVTTINDRSLPRYDLIDNEEEYIGIVYNAIKNTAELNGSSNPTQYALNNLFNRRRGIAPLYNMWNVSDASELIDTNTGRVKDGVTRKYSPTDWADAGYRTGVRNQLNFKMSGGSEKMKHYFSLGYLKDAGYVIKSEYKRYSSRLNLSAKPTKWLKATTNLDYSYGINNDATGYGGGQVTYMYDYVPTIYPLYLRNTDGEILYNENLNAPYYDFGDNRSGNARGFSATYNGVGESIYNINRSNRHSVNGNINLVFDIYEGLTFETTYGMNVYSSNLDRVRNSIQGSSGVASGGTLFKRNSTFIAQNFNQILRYRKELSNKHKIEALLAHESNEDSFEFYDLSKKGVVNLNPDAATIADNYLDQNGTSGGFRRSSALESYFGQLNYNFDDKYYANATLRRDGSSRFYKNKWGTFWSIGAGWIISKEDFFKSSEIFNYFKLKASYGVLGDQGGVNRRTDRGGSNYFGGQDGFSIQNLLGSPSFIPRGIVDPEITWESSNQFQTGLEFELFDGSIEASLDYYIKTTSNLIVDKRLAVSTGDAVIRTNDGELSNRGFEFDITGHLFKKKDFKLSLSVNGEMFDNEILKMPIENSTGKPKVLNMSGRFGHSEGRSIYDYYVREWAGVNKENGNPQWVQHWVDDNNNGQYDEGEGIPSLLIYTSENPNQKIEQRLTSTYSEATEKYVGKSVIPTIRGAFRINSSYKNFSLSAQLGYSLGGYGYDAMYANLMSNNKVGSTSYHVDLRNSWKKPGDITDVPRSYSNENLRVNSTSSRFITSSDYLSLSNVRLGYNFPNRYTERIGISGLNLWLAGDNLFLLSKRKGYNPTTSVIGQSGRYTYNPISSYTIGVRVKL